MVSRNTVVMLLYSISDIIYTHVANYCKLFRINVFVGSRCADDIDGCEDNPCTEGTNCTDLTPAEHVTQSRAYVCTDCPIGYIDDDGTCIGSYKQISPRLSTYTIQWNGIWVVPTCVLASLHDFLVSYIPVASRGLGSLRWIFNNTG